MASPLRRTGRQVLGGLPQPLRRRVRRVKRALLDQPDIAGAPLSRRPTSASAARPPSASGAATSDDVPAGVDPQCHGWNPKPAERVELRRTYAFAVADPDSLILEIGAAHNGIFRKRDGYHVRITDYLDRAGLVDKYKDFPQYSADDIEDVDYVIVPGKPLAEVIPDRFGMVLASHVLEHTTSLVHFLNDCADLLGDGGTLALVVPDHRFCFDRFRERSSLGRVIDTFHAPPALHTPGTHAEFLLNAVKRRGAGSWVDGHDGEYAFIERGERAVASWAGRCASNDYVDVHNWVFTPHHLRLLLDDLHTLGVTPLREAFFHPTIGHEFFLSLKVDGGGPGCAREELVALADAELRMDVPVFAPAPVTMSQAEPGSRRAATVRIPETQEVAAGS